MRWRCLVWIMHASSRLGLTRNVRDASWKCNKRKSWNNTAQDFLRQHTVHHQPLWQLYIIYSPRVQYRASLLVLVVDYLPCGWRIQCSPVPRQTANLPCAVFRPTFNVASSPVPDKRAVVAYPQCGPRCEGGHTADNWGYIMGSLHCHKRWSKCSRENFPETGEVDIVFHECH